MRIVLTLTVDYDISAYNDRADAASELQATLHYAVGHMVGAMGFFEGRLTGPTAALVDDWSVETDLSEE